jgi:hypothetical protein
MDKKYLISVVLILFSVLTFAYTFPNEILYYQKPQVAFCYSDGDYEFSISSRILLDTFFKYKVSDKIVAGLMDTESSFIIHSISTSNALGPFQMKPFIAQEIGVLNPFNPYSDKKVSSMLNRYKSEFGSMDSALGAYHIGFYGTKKLTESGKSPLSDGRINNYVKKNHGFQRLYNEGDWITLKDYLWFDLSYSLGNRNKISLTAVVPEFFLGSLALKANYLSTDEPSFDNFNFSIFQDFSFFWFLNLFVGYEEGVVAGCSLKSNDWFDRITLRYDFENKDLMWSAYNSFGWFFMNYGFSKNNIFFSPGIEIDKKYLLALKVDYKNFSFLPGIECVIKF